MFEQPHNKEHNEMEQIVVCWKRFKQTYFHISRNGLYYHKSSFQSVWVVNQKLEISD